MNNPIKVTIRNEGRHEKTPLAVAAVYPKGMHAAIAEGLQPFGYQIRTATLDEPEHGLSEEVLADTDVLT